MTGTHQARVLLTAIYLLIGAAVAVPMLGAPRVLVVAALIVAAVMVLIAVLAVWVRGSSGERSDGR